jgi:tetratricopeptide (TPR) repeat protein
VQLTPLSSSDASSDPISVDFRVGLRDRMKRELAAFLAEIARERPFVLFLEDLHWADVASIELLAYLTTKFDQLPVLVIAAARPTELMLADHPFLHVKLDLKSRGICQEMALGFLSREAVGQYVSREFPGHRFPQGFIELIYAKTEGSPLFLVDLLRHLRDRQLIVPSNGSWQVVAPMADVEKEAPESVRSMIQRKMDQLDDTDRRLLSTASVQGSEFDAAVVARVHKMDILDAEERLDRLDRVHSFVRCAYELELPNSSLTTRYRFVHALYQNAFYSSLRTARRVALSLKVAKSLLRFHGNKANELATELAILFEAGRDFQQAGKFYLAAARSAGRRGVHRQEAVLLSQAIRIAERLGQKERIAKLRARRGTAFFMVGLWQDARPELDAALADLPAEQFALRAKVLVVLASVCHWLADVPNTRRYAGQALELAELAGRNDLAAAALGALALADSSDGKLHASLSGFEQAFVRTERVDTARMAPHLELSGLVLYWLGRPEEAIRRNRDALQIGRSTSDSSTVVRALGNLGIAQTAAGRYDEALRVFDEAQRLGKEYEVGTAMARAMAMRAGLHLELCDFARAEALTEEARDMGRSLNFSHPVISGGLDLMFNFVRRGDVGRAERLMDEVAEGVRKGAGAHGWLWKLRFAQAQAELALARGSWDEALRQADSSIAQGRATGRVKYEILGLEAQAKAHAALGRQHQAIGQLRSAIELARSIGNPAMFLRVAISLLMIESDEALAAEARAAISRISAALPDEQLRRCFQLSEPVQWLHRAIP